LFLLDKQAEISAKGLETCVRLLKDIQAYLKTDKSTTMPETDSGLSGESEVGKKWLAGLNLAKITSNITNLSSKLGVFKATPLVYTPMLDILESVCLSRDKDLEATYSYPSFKLRDTLEHMKIRELKAYFRSIDVEAERYIYSADAQRQTVYALIAQKDNLVNMEATQASIRIAESSRADSNSMKVVAQATARDSASMSVVTTITAIFLPGTFTATLFSTNFFNFQSTTQGRLVSPWLWLYWALTGLLTALILGVWFFFSRRKTKIIEQQLHDNKVLLQPEFQPTTVVPKPLNFPEMSTFNRYTFAPYSQTGN
jgi:hypothetical protein